MSLVKTARVAEIEREEVKGDKLPKHITNVLNVIEVVKSAAKSVKEVPSSIMLQVLLYGDTFKRVVTRVDVNYDEFEKKYSALVEKLYRSKLVVDSATKHSYYNRFWVDVKTSDIHDIQSKLNYLLEPLRNLGIADFQLRSDPRFNWKFSEAVETYVFQERIEGISFFNRANNSLTIYSKVRGVQPKFSVSDALIDYYVLLRLEHSDNGTTVVYGCTCPYARGETRDTYGKAIPPGYTGMCKHVLATLFYFFPNIFAYVVASRGTLNEENYLNLLNTISESYDKFKARLDEVARSYSTSHQPQSPNEETPMRVIYSNIVYLFFREFLEALQQSERLEVKKLVPTVSHLYEFDALWKSLSVKSYEIFEDTSVPTTPSVEAVLTKVMPKVEDLGIYDRLKEVKTLLNGLQGSMDDTPYTRSLIAALVLGSNLASDPIIVSSYGDPGTGKTLTATGVGELVGFKSLVIEKEVSTEDVLSEAKKSVGKRVEKYVNFFERIVLPKVPKDKVEEASEFFRKSIEDVVSSVTSEDLKDLSQVARKFAEVFATLYGVESKRAIISLAKLYLSLMKLSRKLFLEYVSGKAVERKVLDERRAILTKLQELGLISSAEEKERFNSGAVRWDVQQTTFGYRILVYVDLHYLYSKLGGDRGRIEKVVEELSKVGSIRYTVQRGGVAEVKLSETSYLEKSLRTREEDVGGKLIWVGGELTRMGVILIDESRRAPELLERMLTDLSKAARDSRRTNIIITADNAEPLMEAESDPRLDAFHSRVNFEVATPSSTVEATIEDTLKKINELDISGKLPLVTFDELYLLNVLSEFVHVPERYIQLAYSIPLLMVYDFKVLRPEVVRATAGVGRSKASEMPPLILLIPKGSFEASDVKGDYETPSWGVELPSIRRMPERRFGHHVMRAMKALAIAEKKTVVDENIFITAISTVLPSRVIPVDVQDPYKYFDHKHRVLDTITNKVREVLRSGQTNTEKLIEVIGSMSSVPPDLLENALEEMINNPVLIAVFCRFLEQMLVSKKANEFVEYSKTVPGLYRTLDLLARYEKLPIKIL